ncbi:MAG: helix-turn-helix domain-containing protein [Verrucomicrobiae bacterium]|nr:helix-turn-helix domain-containing protein [Verrucomicrobiae bacterium]
MSVSQAADFLGISVRSVRRHSANGDLAHRRVGWLLKYERSVLDAFAKNIGGNRKGRAR